MELDEKFARTLKKYRAQSLLSQEKLANKCGLDRTFISLLERGKRKPTLKTIFILTKALNVLPSTFIKEIEEMDHESNKY